MLLELRPARPVPHPSIVMISLELEVNEDGDDELVPLTFDVGSTSYLSRFNLFDLCPRLDAGFTWLGTALPISSLDEIQPMEIVVSGYQDSCMLYWHD